MNLIQSSSIYPKEPNIVTIKNCNGLEMTVMDWGATILELLVPVNNDKPRNVVLSLRNTDDWETQKVAINAIVGRFANRIANSEFEIDNQIYKLQSKFTHCLHGGNEGFDRKRFNIEKLSDSSLSCTLISPDGDMGFPGEFTLTVTYTITEDNCVQIHFFGTSNKKTYANITSHCYFNLNGYNSSCLNHSMQSSAKQYLEIRTDGIPTGKILDCKNTAFDFSSEKAIGSDIYKIDNYETFRGYDHPIINPENIDHDFITITSDDKKLKMNIRSDYPAFQIYTANFMSSKNHVLIAKDNNQEYLSHCAICIEPEFFPDYPHLKEFAKLNPIVSKENPLDKTIKIQFY